MMFPEDYTCPSEGEEGSKITMDSTTGAGFKGQGTVGDSGEGVLEAEQPLGGNQPEGQPPRRGSAHGSEGGPHTQE